MGVKSTLSNSLHKVISNSPPKTERLLSLFLITVISLMSVVMLTVMTQYLKVDLTKHYLDSNKQRAINLANQIERFIDVRVIQLQSQAKNPIVQQTTMQPGANTGLIRDYFNTQSIIGKQYPQQIFDFKGDKIFCSTTIEEQRKVLDNKPLPKVLILQRFHPLYAKETNILINLTSNLKYWEIALPVQYGESIEGVLVSYISVNEMANTLGLNNISDIQISATANNDIEVKWGARKINSLTELPKSQTGIRLTYGINASSLNNSFTKARNRLILSSVFIAFFAIGFAFIMGKWFFVRPIERLQSFANAVSKGSSPHLKKTKRITIEIQQLSDQITDMAKKIQLREKSLVESNEALKRNQDTLVHSEKMAGLGQVTAGVAHEINNPIGFIMNNLTMLQEYNTFLKTLISQLFTLKDKLSEEEQKRLHNELNDIAITLQQEDLDFVINDLDCITGESITGAERVKEIIQGLKGYTYSGEKGSLIDINECVESTLKMVWNELKYHCTVDKDLEPLPLLECMGGQINQVLMNLFVNAAHAMTGKNGLLYIQTKCHKNNILIKVTDNGCGIPTTNLKHIFDPFFTTKPVGEGTGLGMSICYDIIKNHGGDIKVHSRIDEGTTFVITLPISSNDQNTKG